MYGLLEELVMCYIDIYHISSGVIQDSTMRVLKPRGDTFYIINARVTWNKIDNSVYRSSIGGHISIVNLRLVLVKMWYYL